MDEREEDQTEHPRPRVVDKRVSARTTPDPAPTADPVPPAAGTEHANEGAEASSPSDPASQPSPPPASGPASAPEAEGEVWTPEREAQAREMAKQIAETPSLEWVVNVAVTLANVAGTKLDLGAGPDARLAIDALAGIIDKLGSELGETEAPLRNTLAQLQMAYAQTVTPPPSS